MIGNVAECQVRVASRKHLGVKLIDILDKVQISSIEALPPFFSGLECVVVSVHLALLTGAMMQEAIGVLSILNALRTAFLPKDLQDIYARPR